MAVGDAGHRQSRFGLDYWLRRCEGFRVDGPAGRSGHVRGIRFGDAAEPKALEVRAGRDELLLRLSRPGGGARADLQPRPPQLRDRYGVRAYRDRVDDLDETLARLAEQGIEPERAPYRVREGGSRLTFVRDPDSYRVELIEQSGK